MPFAGERTVIWVALLTLNDVAGMPPNETASGATKFFPVMTTIDAPVVGPLFGFTASTIGPFVYVNTSAAVCGLEPDPVVTTTCAACGPGDGGVVVVSVLGSTNTAGATMPPIVMTEDVVKLLP